MSAREPLYAGKDQQEKGSKGKRKRKPVSTDADADADADGNGTSPGAKAPRKRKAKAKAEAQTPEPAAATVEPAIEWPAWFTSLEKTHRALNLVFTFSCTRKHLVTTFDTMRSAVESHIKRELTVEEVAAVVALRPEGIRFAYVDELMLQIDVKGAERDDTFQTGKHRGKTSQSMAPDASVGGVTGLEGLAVADGGGVTGKEVLFFEFVDEDLKRLMRDKKTGEPTNPSRKLREDALKMPVFSQKQMTGLIEKRNTKFAQAIDRFLKRCAAEALDPEMALRSEAEAFAPKPSTPSAGTPAQRAVADSLPETIPKERKSIPEIVQELKDSLWYTGQIVPDGHRVFAAQEPVYGHLDFLLSQDLVNALYNAKGITSFYAHQAEAINGLHAARHVVVATSTSSGKSLIYQLPVLHALEHDPDTRAMYIFPTKALAQDQKRSLRDMMSFMPGLASVLVETFDGDTPMGERNMIRDEARIIFTNPDMLHMTILPQEERWRTFLKNLRYVVGEPHSLSLTRH